MADDKVDASPRSPPRSDMSPEQTEGGFRRTGGETFCSLLPRFVLEAVLTGQHINYNGNCQS